MSHTSFEHERFPVYQDARRFAAKSFQICGNLPPGSNELKRQLIRAGASVPLNIAEAGGEFAPAEKARFLRIARRSATECAALLDLLEDRQSVTAEEASAARVLLLNIVPQLTAMVIAQGKRLRR